MAKIEKNEVVHEEWLHPGLMHDYDLEGSRPLGQKGGNDISITRNLLLASEPMPKVCYGVNYRKHLGEFSWRGMRQEMLIKYDYHCKFCGATDRLECHEVWSYEIYNRIQRLIDLEIVCRDCHEIKHAFRTIKMAPDAAAAEAKMSMQFAKVNRCPEVIFREQLFVCQEFVRELNKYNDWQTDFITWETAYRGKTMKKTLNSDVGKAAQQECSDPDEGW